MKNFYPYLLCFIAFISVLNSRLDGQTTVTLAASKDNTIFSEGSKSNGTGIYLFSGRTEAKTNGVRRALVQFDVSGIPANATITDVKLQLTGSKQAANGVKAHRVTTVWGEGNSDAGSQEGGGAAPGTNDATWAFSNFSTASWTTAGGDFAASASATANVSSGVTTSWSGADIIKDVQAWVTGQASNFGWIMIGDENTAGSAVRLNSRQNTAGTPALVVTYTVPVVKVDTTVFVATLSGRNEGNPVATLANGAVTATLIGDTLRVSGSFSGLTDSLATNVSGGAHLHLGYAGQNGGIQIGLVFTPGANPFSGSFDPQKNKFKLTANQLTALNNRQLYANIHSKKFPSGEIRGQLLKKSDVYYGANLFGSYENPVVMTQASGAIAVELSGTQMIVTGSFNRLEGDFAADVSGGAHIHLGYAGQNGAIQIPLKATANADLKGGVFEAANNTITLTADQITALNSRRWYANVHSAKARSGEIRGQIINGNTRAVFRAHLSGSNEPPAVNTLATGMVIVEVVDTANIIVSGAYNNLESDLAVNVRGGAHIHRGLAGENGGILTEVTLTPTDLRSGALNASLNALRIGGVEVQRLFNRGCYFNVHSATFTGGEIRGQLLPEKPINFSAYLSSIFEVPEAVSRGLGAVKAELLGTELVISGTFRGLSSAVATDVAGGSHVHLGYAGATGAIQFGLKPTIDANGLGGRYEAKDNTFTLTADQVTQLKNRQLYVNIHTATQRSGELRSQLLPEATMYLVAPLSGASEQPVVNTIATGMGVIEIAGSTGTLTGAFAGLSADFAADVAGGAHIHRGLAGSNGSITKALKVTTLADNRSGFFAAADNGFTMTAGFIDSLRKRLSYANIHTAAFRGGEVRGQILPLATSYFTATLLGANEVQAVASTGSGALKFELSGTTLTLTGRFAGLQAAYAAAVGSHIHTNTAGKNGGVIIPIKPTLDADNLGGSYFAADNQYTLTADQVNALYDNGLYANIHSDFSRSGELRGQILPEINRFPQAGAITSPPNGGTLTLQGKSSTLLEPKWDAGTDKNKLAYTWELAADPLFALVVFRRNVADALSISLTYGSIDTLLASVGIPLGGSITVYHRVRASDGSLTTAGAVASVTLTRGVVTDTRDLTPGLSEMTVFPTLVEDQVSVRIRAEEAIDGLIWVSDAFGRKMVQRRIALPAQSLSLETIELGNLPAGNYFLSIMNNGKIATRRFIRK
ncbi:CHRD domain-containing protein [Haliscomenobacter sp.]|uniref:CHRD domain-containing protein n=1 Tax=Haliscomenobacter sp. TaxID=2717303 RepID=UPI00336529F0